MPDCSFNMDQYGRGVAGTWHNAMMSSSAIFSRATLHSEAFKKRNGMALCHGCRRTRNDIQPGLSVSFTRRRREASGTGTTTIEGRRLPTERVEAGPSACST